MNDRPAWMQRYRQRHPDSGLEAAGKIIAVFFLMGFAVGACTLGFKLPIALLDLAIK